MFNRFLKTMANALIGICMATLAALMLIVIFPPALLVIIPFVIIPAWIWIIICVVVILAKWDYIKGGKDDD